jgi:endo-1,4-beta-xylanase
MRAARQSFRGVRALAGVVAIASFGCAGNNREPAAKGHAGERVRCRVAAPDTGGEVPSAFAWNSSDPLVTPAATDRFPIVSVKDPSVVYFEDAWHVLATTANVNAQWSLVYTTFRDWADAPSAAQRHLAENPNLVGYHAAPQVFFFAPQNRWYLVFQSGQPQYSTTDDITRPETWSRPTNFFATIPEIVSENQGTGTWLDFWVICDDTSCYLFFTSRTDLGRFPEGFEEPVIALEGTKETLFEGSSTYRLDGTDRYLTLIEAFGPGGTRYYRSFVAETLDGEWVPLADSWENPFASSGNVTFESGTAWTNEISHGELVRSGYDQRLTVSLNDTCFLYQGLDPAQSGVEYSQRPYRLALLSPRE